MTGAFLLDVNVLVALFDASHVHHETAHDWFADHRSSGWATCPITENGFLRVLTHPAVAIETDRTTLLAGLATFRASGHHEFWGDSVSFCDPSLFDASAVLTHGQLTDVYLLGLAARKGGHLATFDRSIPLRAVRGATRQHLAVIAPAG